MAKRLSWLSWEDIEGGQTKNKDYGHYSRSCPIIWSSKKALHSTYVHIKTFRKSVCWKWSIGLGYQYANVEQW